MTLLIDFLGASPQTSTNSSSQCGFSAIENMSLTGSQTGNTAYFHKVKTAFLNAGHKMGVTLQALPFDFRIAYQENDELKHRFKGIISSLHNNLGKKVVILAHG